MGDDGSAIEGIRKMVKEPQIFNILPYRHNHTENREFICTAMFIPAYRMVASLLDSRGYCDEDAAIEWYNKVRFTKSGDAKSLLIYKAEYCFTIEEALIQEGDNIFPKAELAEQEAAITLYKTVPKPTIGNLTWVKDSEGSLTRQVKWSYDPEYGKVLIVEPPRMDDNGNAYSNLYVGGIDSIDIGSTDAATDTDVSEFCIVIKRRIFGIQEPQYVAIYKDRPKDPREAYEMAAKLLVWYNCKAVLESTRTAILTYFREHKYIDLLLKRPRSTMPDVTKSNSNMIGAPATVKVINHYRELLYDFIIDYSHTINFIEMVDQFLRYSDKEKRKFDIVAAAGMAELGDEELSSKKPEPYLPEGKVFRDFGWWIDNKGYRHYGEIGKPNKNDRDRISPGDSWLYKDPL